MRADLTLAPAFQGQQVRIVLVNDEPWFVATDVAEALDLANVRSSLALLDDDEKGVHSMDTPGGVQQVATINEPGMYSLILRSRKAEAKAFKRWITHEVLPQIRRTGSYTGSQPAIPETLPEALRLAADLAEERDAARAALAEVAPKVEAYEALMDSDGLYSMAAAAKAIGIGRNTMMRRLRELDILQGNNLPYQRHMHHFDVVLGTYTDRNGNTHPTTTTRVQPAGVDYIRRRLASQIEVAR